MVQRAAVRFLVLLAVAASAIGCASAPAAAGPPASAARLTLQPTSGMTAPPVQVDLTAATPSSPGQAPGEGSISQPGATGASATAGNAGPPDDSLGGEQRGTGFVGRLFATDPKEPATGTNELDLALADLEGKPISDADVTYDVNMTTMHHSPQVVDASPSAPGRYWAQVEFSMLGPWRVVVTIERPGEKAQQLQFDFNVEITGGEINVPCH